VGVGQRRPVPRLLELPEPNLDDAGRLGDLYGRRRIFLVGLSILAAASLLGGVSTGPALLLAGRGLQGVASAMAVPAALSLLITTFADERQRAWVLGLNGSLLSAGFTVGAIAGGMLVGGLSWRWAFLINVPVAFAILALTPVVVPAARSLQGVRLDVPGAASVTLGLFAIAFGVPNRPLPALIIGLVLLALFFGSSATQLRHWSLSRCWRGRWSDRAISRR
jgi:MFS family permease